MSSLHSITNRETSKESRKAEFLQRKQIANLIPSAPQTKGQKAAQKRVREAKQKDKPRKRADSYDSEYGEDSEYYWFYLGN